MSALRQHQILSRQLQEIMEGIAEAKENNAERFTIKQMERHKAQYSGKDKKTTITKTAKMMLLPLRNWELTVYLLMKRTATRIYFL